MRAPFLLQTLFALGSNSPDYQHCNGLTTSISMSSFAFVDMYHRIHFSDLSLSVLFARKKTSGLVEEFEKATDSQTACEQWLEKRFGFNEEELGRIFALRPQLLTLKVPILEERANWLQERLSLKAAEIRKMILRFPNLLSYSIENNIEPTFNYYQARLRMNDAALLKSLKNHPHLLSLSIEENVEPKLVWLQQQLNVTEVQLGKLVTKAPSILNLSIEDNLEPKIEWLQERLNLDEAQVGKLTVKLPNVLVLSIKENLEPKLDWLQSRLNLTDAQVSKIARAFPSIFSFSVSALEPALRWLQESLSLEDTGLTKLVVAQPALLCLDLETNLEATFNFYKECIGDEETQLLLTRNPVLFMASLERRLKPRLEQAEEAGLAIDSGCLRRIAKSTEEEWQSSLVFQQRKVLKETLW